MGSKRPKPHFTEVFAFPKRPKGLVWDAWKTGFQLVYSGSGRLLTVKFMKTSKPVSFVLLFYSFRFRIVAVVAINFTTQVLLNLPFQTSRRLLRTTSKSKR